MTLAKSPSSHPSGAVLTTKTQTLLARRASQSKFVQSRSQPFPAQQQLGVLQAGGGALRPAQTRRLDLFCPWHSSAPSLCSPIPLFPSPVPVWKHHMPKARGCREDTNKFRPCIRALPRFVSLLRFINKFSHELRAKNSTGSSHMACNTYSMRQSCLAHSKLLSLFP